MDRKAVIAGLRAYRRIDDEIRRKILYANELDSGGGSDGDPYRREANDLRTLKREIIRCLNELHGTGGEAILYHYVKGWAWVRVALKYAYSERQIREIAYRALDRLGQAFDASPAVADFCRRETKDTI